MVSHLVALLYRDFAGEAPTGTEFYFPGRVSSGSDDIRGRSHSSDTLRSRVSDEDTLRGRVSQRLRPD